MRMLSKLLAGPAAAATVVVLTAGPALADPPSGTTPAAGPPRWAPGRTPPSTCSTSSRRLQQVPRERGEALQLGRVNPDTLALGDNIVTKKGCAAIARPNGSGAGIAQLETNVRALR